MRNLHQEITDRIVARLKAGVCSLASALVRQRLWRHAAQRRHRSRLLGANVLLLWSRAQESGFAASLWLTFKQALELGGNVRKGEKGETVIYVSKIIKEDKDGATPRDSVPQGLYGFQRRAVRQPASQDRCARTQPRASSIQTRATRSPTLSLPRQAPMFVMAKPRAYYRPLGDFMNLPHFETFTNAARYYGRRLHELSHWTGAEKRLDRTFGKRLATQAYCG